MEIAKCVGVYKESDITAPDHAVFIVWFKRAKDGGLLGKLWDETESRHTDPAIENPFKAS